LTNFTKQEIMDRCEKAGITFAPIARPEDLFHDPQLNEGNSLLTTTLPDGTITKLPKTPIEYEGADIALRMNPPSIGEHTKAILLGIGYTEGEIEQFNQQKIIAS
jgi:crotonobetainyl-CoA:carnitine CoA-transferase CaiB-like acyl-CoA transferase